MMAEFDGRVIANPDAMSQAAAESMEPYAGSVRRRVWTLIRSHPEGLACWQVEQITGGLHQTISAAINWLWKYEWLIRVGENRTPSNRRAYIYRAQRGRTP